MLAVVVVVSAGLVLARGAGTWGPAAARTEAVPVAAAATRPVTDSLLVCAAVRPASDAEQTVVAAGAPPGGTGTLSLARLAGPSKPLAVAPLGSSVLRYLMPRGVGGALVVRGTGDRARGLTATATTRTSLGSARSLATAPCTAPAAESWFVGGSAALGRTSVLYLSDADRADAVVDVTVFTSKGAAQPAPAQGVTVKGGHQTALRLDALVPGAQATAVLVRARSGRVASALLDARVSGLVPGGVEWVPPSAPPTQRLVVTGAPGDADTARTLSLLVPGGDDAQVRVRLSTPEGTLSPQPLDNLLVPGGQLQTIDLAKAGVTGPYAVLVDSDKPVVAGVLALRAAKGQLPDFTYGASATAVVGGAAVLPRVDRSPRVTTRLQLTNPGAGDLAVRLTTLVSSGAAPAARSLTVPAGQTVELQVGLPGPAPTAVLVETAARTDLVVGWVLAEAGARGPLVTGGPIVQTALTTPVPPVAPDPATGYPGH